MPIIGFSFDKILVENKMEKGKMPEKVETHIIINDIKQEDAGVNVKEGILRLSFLFELEYTPKVADMLLGGKVTYVGEDKETKKIFANWKKDQKNMDFNAIRPIINFVLVKCNIKALELSQEVNLPPHLPIPVVGPQSPAKKPGAEKYIG